MKLLILTNNPDRASFRQRIEVYLPDLQNCGVECSIVRFPSGLLPRYKLLKSTAAFDAVFLHKKRINIFDALPLRYYSNKIIYDIDDAVMYSDKKSSHDSASRKRRFERTVKLADIVIAGNSYLAKHAEDYNANVHVLATGLSVADYNCKAKVQSDGKIRMVWIGSKSTLCYLKEIRPALEEIGAKFNNVALKIICDDFFDLKNMPVEKCVWSLERQVHDLVSSDIGLAPLPDNRFTRGKCGFKILQYQAAGLPVVASGVGVNAEYVRDGVDGFLAKDNGDWVEKLLRLINDEQLRRQMADAGQRAVQQFDVGVIGRKLCHLITECLKDTARDDND